MRIWAVIALSLLIASAASAENRTALVIGNSAYTTMSPLKNPRNDAVDLATTLRKLGFDVTVKTDLGEDEMKLAIRQFAKKLREREGVGFFYYAGHGVEVGGQNFLIPVGADIPAEEYVDLRAVSLREVTAGLRVARNRLNVIVLDACRDNPFAGQFRSAGRGLKAVRPPAETLIAYAADSGQVAADGDGRNSPYAEALIAEVQRPGVRLVDVFRNVKRRVRRATGGAQNPWQADDLSLTADNAWYFVPSSSSGGGPQLAAVGPAPSPGGFSLNDLDEAAKAEEKLRQSWASRLSAMEEAYAEVEAYETRGVSDALKVQAWERFSDAYKQDDPYSSRDDELRALAEERVAALRPRYASLTVRSNVADDTVYLDGRPLGPTGAHAHEIEPGRHTIRVAKAGYRSFETSVVLAAGDRRTLRAELEALVAAAAPMVRVPGGEFWYGCNEKVDRECDDDEKPGRRRSLPAFEIDRTEVTVKAYAECVDAGGCSSDGLRMPYWAGEDRPGGAWACNWGRSGREGHPINCVDWHQARAYCQWRGARLPSEAEWEKAARGTDGRKYAWGNRGYGSANKVANIADATAKREKGWSWAAADYDDGYTATSPVGSFPNGASPYGALDMIGNVWEWTSDWYSTSRKYRVFRGGSWRDMPRYARASRRNRVVPAPRYELVGFRCDQ